VRLHLKKSKSEARAHAIGMLERVKMPSATLRVDEYPHQLSGGMRQRVMIAMALACTPRLLIADEPTTALDVTIQAQILDLLRELQQESGMSILFITHDLGVVAEIADHVAVMYASKVVEHAPVKELFANPLHPYTLGLFRSRPSLATKKGEKLNVIPGAVPNPLRFPSGCKFHPRCPQAVEACRSVEPRLREVKPGHWVACDVVT
jgi:oligopeptide/dipeptide ABC transporter ATP-binding protein